MHNQDVIRTFFEKRPSLNLTMLEKESNVPRKTLSHFVNQANRRPIPERHLENVIAVLKKYGLK